MPAMKRFLLITLNSRLGWTPISSLLIQLKQVVWKDFNYQIQESDFRTVFEMETLLLTHATDSQLMPYPVGPGHLFRQAPK